MEILHANRHAGAGHLLPQLVCLAIGLAARGRDQEDPEEDGGDVFPIADADEGDVGVEACLEVGRRVEG